MQDDFEKNWTDGTFPGWPVNIFMTLLCYLCSLWNYCFNRCDICKVEVSGFMKEFNGPLSFVRTGWRKINRTIFVCYPRSVFLQQNT